MEKVKILAIGNSFSQDATYYLHQLAKHDGLDTKVVNLYIGGCSLDRHWENILEDAKLYLYERDGRFTGQYVSIKEALVEENWDYITIQQASHDSGISESYFPFVHDIFEYIKKYVPESEILIHQTWAYEIDSTHDRFYRYENNQYLMYQKLREAYDRAAEELNIRLIPCGDIIQMKRTIEPFIYQKGGLSLCRDGYHMSYLYGRYALAATWYEILFHKNILINSYIPNSEFVPEETVNTNTLDSIKNCVHKMIEEKRLREPRNL